MELRSASSCRLSSCECLPIAASASVLIRVLLVEKAEQPEIDFHYRIFNSDGGEVEQCGNGARCFVKFVHDEGLTSKSSIRVQTLAGIIEPRLQENGRSDGGHGECRASIRPRPDSTQAV
jgi:diaminopimelate epimerase